MLRVAVLGATGMAGHVIGRYLEEHEYDVYRTSRSIEASRNSEPLDATDIGGLFAWLDRVQPACVINAMGILPREAEARPDLAILLNAYLPHKLAHKYQSRGTKVIHLSTDCVFSGATPLG